MATTTQFKTQPLIAPQQPRLPATPLEYSQQYQEQYSNVLRLYFNQLQNFNQLFTTNTGGSLLQFPNGSFHQDGYTTLTAAMTNVSTTPIQVVSTTGFLSAGALLIGTELIQYTGKTSTTFTGITRGVYGSTRSAHSIGDYASEAQPVASATTALAVTMTTTDVSNGVAVDSVDKTKIVFSVAGYYNIAFSAQMLTLDTTISNCTFWFRKNGTDVTNSAGIVSVPAVHGGVPGVAIVSWNQVLDLTANDYIQLMYATDTGNVVLATYPPGTAPTHPASPSVALTATFVSALFP